MTATTFTPGAAPPDDRLAPLTALDHVLGREARVPRKRLGTLRRPKKIPTQREEAP